MRPECQAVIATWEDGSTYAATHVMTAEFFQKTLDNTVVCGKPAVDAADQAHLLPDQPGMSILDRLKRIKFPLCAEHWDQYQQSLKEEHHGN